MLSIIIPFYNEEENLPKLYDELMAALSSLNEEYEIVFVDDGSTDKSISNFKLQISNFDQKKIKIISHRKRLGKGMALNTGIKHASGEIIIFMDADLQNDPKEIPQFLQKIREGYELVNGKRNKRDGNSLIRVYSLLANTFLQIFLHSPFSDVNCAFKAIKREVFDEIVLYANNFRFLPLAAYYRGFKVTEVTVHNRRRLHGESKFGATKIFIGMFDTLTAYFLYRFSEQPLHFFGSIGGLFFGIGFIMALYMSVERLFFGVLLYRRPALQLAILLIIVGIQIIMTGFIGELIVYISKRKSKGN